MTQEKMSEKAWIVPAAAAFIIAVAIALYMAWTLIVQGTPKWEVRAVFGSLSVSTWDIVVAPLWIVGTALFFLELSGRTLKGFKIVKYSVRWDSVDLATAALCAAVYGGGLAATGGLTIIPGSTWIRPANIFATLFGMLFGIPGAIGIAVGNLLADSLAGFLGWGSIGGGFIGNFLLAYIPYKLVSDPSFKRAKAWFEYYLFGAIGSAVWCAFYIAWFLAVTSGTLTTLPPPVAWGFFAPFVIVNNAIAFIFTPLLGIVLYPLVKSWGLFWKDRITYK